MAQTVMFAIGDLENLVAMCHTQVEHWIFARNAIVRQAGSTAWSEYYRPKALKTLSEGRRYLERARELHKLLTDPQEIHTAAVMLHHAGIRHRDLSSKLA
nr:MAG TPA: hypothetical protein [Caudoviricetes sp.]